MARLASSDNTRRIMFWFLLVIVFAEARSKFLLFFPNSYLNICFIMCFLFETQQEFLAPDTSYCSIKFSSARTARRVLLKHDVIVFIMGYLASFWVICDSLSQCFINGASVYILGCPHSYSCETSDRLLYPMTVLYLISIFKYWLVIFCT